MIIILLLEAIRRDAKLCEASRSQPQSLNIQQDLTRMDEFISILSRRSEQLRLEPTPFRGLTLILNDAESESLRHEKLLCHWEELVSSLQCQETNYRRQERFLENEGWWLDKIHLSTNVLEILTPALASRNIRTLYLDRNTFGRDGIAFVCQFLEQNSTLKRLSLCNNPMENIDDVNRFCSALSKHCSMENLVLKKVGLDDDSAKLSAIFEASNKLKCLSLPENGIGTQGGIASSQFIARNTAMKTMYLSENSLDDNDALLMANALYRNTNICTLDLIDNKISLKGKRTIQSKVFDTTNLNATANSNHTCKVWIDEKTIRDKLEVINCKDIPSENRKGKIFSILCAHSLNENGNRLGQLLEEIPLNLMPNVLSLLQGDANELPLGVKKYAMGSVYPDSQDDSQMFFSKRTPLTLIFEVILTWNLPWLFVNL